jgi:hypothetical protein
MIIKVLEKAKWDSLKCSSEGKTIYLKPSSKCTAVLEIGKEYDVKTYQPEGKKTIYITGAVQCSAVPTVQPIVNKAPEQAPIVQTPVVVIEKAGDNKMLEKKPSQEYWEKKEKKQQSGLAQGNYRTILGTFLTQVFCKEGRFPEEVEITEFNTNLKLGESDYFECDKQAICEQVGAIVDEHLKEWEF